VSSDGTPARLADAATITTYPRHEPALIAAASFQTTAGSRCGTFGQAELTARCDNPPITRFLAEISWGGVAEGG